MAVPILNLSVQYQALRAEIDAAIQAVVAAGQFVLGPNVRALEEEMAGRLGVSAAVAVASGTDALHLALRALDLGPGDLVLIAPFTFIATATAVTCAGARPVFADIRPETYTLDPQRAAECLAGCGPRGLPPGRVRAILPVHLYGLPADMPALEAVARDGGLRIVEDAAQAIGAACRGRAAGALGDAAAFSFYPTKNLGAMGDAGMVTTSNEAVAQRVRRLRVYGGRQRYVHEELGFNSRLDEIQAAVLRVKLRHLDRWTARRRAIAERYRAGLGDCDVGLPHEPPGAVHCYHQFAIRVPDRDGVQRRMADRGVATAVYYPLPLHLQPMYRELGYREGDFPEAERAAREVLCLPMYPELTDAQVDEVVEAVKHAL